MATKQDLDSAESNLEAAITQLNTDLNTAVADLLAAINGGSTDLTAEVTPLITIGGQVAAMDAKLQASDPAGVPVISSPTTAAAPLNAAFTYQIAGSKSPTSFNATGLPTGLTVDTTKGVISGTPTVAGVSAVILNATNAAGTGVATLTITVA